MALVFALGSPSGATAAKLEELRIEPQQADLVPGQTLTFSVTGVFDDGSSADITSQVLLISRDTRKVVMEGATARAIASGRALIKAKDPSSGRTTRHDAEIDVGEIEQISLDPPHPSLRVGDALQIRARAAYSNGISGIDVTDRVRWASGKRSVITVAESGPMAGMIQALKVGEALITATDPESGKRSTRSDGTITVVAAESTNPGDEPPPPDGSATCPGRIESLRLDPASIDLLPGESRAVTAILRFKDGRTEDVSGRVVLESRRTKVARALPGAKIKGVGPGDAEVKAQDPICDVRSKNAVKVRVPDVTALRLLPASPVIEVGETLQIQAVADFEDGTTGFDVTSLLGWTSGKRRVATVGNAPGTKGMVTGVEEGEALIVGKSRMLGVQTARGEGTVRVVPVGSGATPPPPGGGGPSPDLPTGKLVDILVQPSALSLLPGQSQRLTALGVWEDGSQADITSRVTFASRRRKIARIQAGNVLLAQRGGDTAVEAEDTVTGRSSKVPAQIHVATLTAITLAPETKELRTCESLQLHALGTFDDGTSGVDITTSLTWKSSRKSIAAVDNGENKGLVFGLKEGTVVVTASSDIAKIASDVAAGAVTVLANPDCGDPQSPPGDGGPAGPATLVDLSFHPPALSIIPGEHRTLGVLGVFSDGTTQDFTDRVTLTSRNARVARIDADGSIVGVRPGDAQIKAEDTATRTQARVNATVTVAKLQAVTISPASAGQRPGKTLQLKALGTYTNGTTGVDVSDQVTWRSEKEMIASVSEDGVVTALAPGKTRIIAKHASGKRSDASSGNFRVVTDLVKIHLTPTRRALQIGESTRYRAFGTFATGEVVDISDDVDWSVADPSIATISQDGKARARAVGDVRIDARDLTTGARASDSGGDRVLSVVGALTGLQVSRNGTLQQHPVALTLVAGETKSLKGLAVFEGRMDVFNLGSRLTWSSSNPAAVSVNRNGLAKCEAVGTAIVSVVDPKSLVTSTDTLGDATVTCAGNVLGLRVEPSEFQLNWQRTKQFRAFRILEDGSTVDVTRRVLWTSTNERAASVSETGDTGGNVTGNDVGTATLVAYDPVFDISSESPGGGSGTVAVVKIRKSLAIFPEPGASGFLSGKLGETLQLKARVTYQGGATEGVNAEVTWASSNPSIVTVSNGNDGKNPGRATLQAVGQVTISATWPGDGISPTLADSVGVAVLP